MDSPLPASYHLASAALGIDIMSPVMPTVTGPGGEILAAGNNNTFADAHFDWDPDDPDGIKMLTIIDPPQGDYEVTLTGTDEGDYTVITSYANEDENVFITQEGTAAPGRKETTSFSIQEGTFIPDLAELTDQLKKTIRRLREEGHIERRGFGRLYGKATALHAHAAIYQRLADRFGDEHKQTRRAARRLNRTLGRFSRTLGSYVERGWADEKAARELTSLTDQVARRL